MEVSTPNGLLPEVDILLQNMPGFLQGLEVAGHLDKGASTCLKNERRTAHDDGALLSASVTTGLDSGKSLVVDLATS